MACNDPAVSTLQNLTAFQGTYLNNRIDTFEKLGDRISRSLGYPLISVEIHRDQLYDNINIACEMFTKFAGYTEEYLVFDSALYDTYKGIKLDTLFLYTPTLCSTFTENAGASGGHDPDLRAPRKVIDVFNFEEGTSTGINTLFTVEQTLAQQTYFSTSMGNYGFDLISWYVLKEWLELREKLLSQRYSYTFNNRTQYLQLFPQPNQNTRFYGVVCCYLERPLSDILKEPWVYQYALALSKISVGNVRGKFNTQLLGGSTINYNDLLSQGLQEKRELEEKLYTSTPGFGDSPSSMFFVG